MEDPSGDTGDQGTGFLMLDPEHDVEDDNPASREVPSPVPVKRRLKAVRHDPLLFNALETRKLQEEFGEHFVSDVLAFVSATYPDLITQLGHEKSLKRPATEEEERGDGTLEEHPELFTKWSGWSVKREEEKRQNSDDEGDVVEKTDVSFADVKKFVKKLKRYANFQGDLGDFREKWDKRIDLLELAETLQPDCQLSGRLTAAKYLTRIISAITVAIVGFKVGAAAGALIGGGILSVPAAIIGGIGGAMIGGGLGLWGGDRLSHYHLRIARAAYLDGIVSSLRAHVLLGKKEEDEIKDKTFVTALTTLNEIIRTGQLDEDQAKEENGNKDDDREDSMNYSRQSPAKFQGEGLEDYGQVVSKDKTTIAQEFTEFMKKFNDSSNDGVDSVIRQAKTLQERLALTGGSRVEKWTSRTVGAVALATPGAAIVQASTTGAAAGSILSGGVALVPGAVIGGLLGVLGLFSGNALGKKFSHWRNPAIAAADCSKVVVDSLEKESQRQMSIS